MGLDISIRYRNLTTDEIKYDDVQLNGRSEFAVVKDWVNQQNKYGEFIPLDEIKGDELIDIIETELNRRLEEAFDSTTEFPWFLTEIDWGLEALYNKLLRAPKFLKYGWIMEVECDW